MLIAVLAQRTNQNFENHRGGFSYTPYSRVD